MNRQHTSGRLWVALAAVAGVLGLVGWTLRDAWAKEDGAAATADSADSRDAAPKGRDWEIPAGDAAALVKFIEKVADAEPLGETEEEQLADAVDRLHTIVEAAERMIDAKPTDEQLVQSHGYRLQALEALTRLGDAQASEDFAAAMETAMEHPRSEIAILGWQPYLYERLIEWRRLDDDAKAALAKRIHDEVQGDEPSVVDVAILTMMATNLDQIDDSYAAELLSASLPALKRSESQDVQDELANANLDGKMRRLALLGQPMEVFGTLLDGGEIDWKSYRGKVVLVDFSATWCPGCVEEAPNVVAMYEQYHDQGFDVVAVSLDRTPEAAQRYIEENNIKWATLFPAKKEERYWNHPLARYYGLAGIPTAILVDQEGRAVDMYASGARLRAKLEELLGPADEPAVDATTSETESGG